MPQIDWMLPAWLANHWRRGWGIYKMDCPSCAFRWTAQARVGTIAAAYCPQCGHAEEMAWGDGSGQTVGHDGVWL